MNNDDNNERVKTFKSMGIVEKFPAFSDEDIQNVCNNILVIIIIYTLTLCCDGHTFSS